MKALSVNQLVSETRKALVGRGASFGVADDIAKAVQLLAHYNIVPSDEIATLLQKPQFLAPQMPEISDANLTMAGDVGIVDVMAMLDFVIAYDVQQIIVSGLLYPRLSHGLIALSQSPHTGSFVDDTGMAIEDRLANNADHMCLHYIAFRAPKPPLWPRRVMIDEADYDLIKLAAFHSYVPSSAQSREAGAGAGLHDND